MRARELAEPFPTVTLQTDAVEAARTMGANRLPGLIVLDEQGRPHTVVPGSQVLRLLLPRYVQDDPSLAGVYSEQDSDALLRRVPGTPVRQLFPHPQDRDELPAVDPDATLLEVAAMMVQRHSPIVAVVDHHRFLGAVTVSRLFEVLFPDDGGKTA